MIFDAASLYAFFVQNAEQHWSVLCELELASSYEQLVISPFVIVELEQRVRDRFGAKGWLLVLEQLAGGAWTIATVDAAHLEAMRERVEDGASLAEASVAVLREADS